MDHYVLFQIDIDKNLLAPNILLSDAECAIEIFNRTSNENSCIPRESLISLYISLISDVSYILSFPAPYMASPVHKVELVAMTLVH